MTRRRDVTYRQETAPPCPSGPGGPTLPEERWDDPTLSSYQIRVAEAIRFNLNSLATRYGIHTLGFITLTFANPEPSIEEAQARFERYRRGFMNKRTDSRWLAVAERSPVKRRLHFHVVASFPFDLREGFLWDAYDARKRGVTQRLTTNKRLTKEWTAWREACEEHGFGIPQGPIPLRKDAGAIAWYLAGYLAKAVIARDISDANHKLVHCGSNARRSTVRTAPASENAKEWRAALARWSIALWGEDASLDRWAREFGPGWARTMGETIRTVDPLSDGYRAFEAL